MKGYVETDSTQTSEVDENVEAVLPPSGAANAGRANRVASKTCTCCAITKPLSAFYAKRASYEAICKDCKKARRNKAHPTTPVDPPNSPAEPAPSERGEQPDRKQIEHQQADDFWDKKYGRPLTDEEKREIKFNLDELIAVLREEHRRTEK